MQNFLVALLLVLTTAVWGFTFPVIKDAIQIYGVMPFLAVRFLLASLCLGLLCRRRLRKSTVIAGGLIGLTLAGGYLFQTFGLRGTTATNCGWITGLFIVFVLLFNRWFFGKRVAWPAWLAVGGSLVGLILLTGTGPQPFNQGDVLTLGAALCFGLQITLVDRWSKTHDPLTLAWIQITMAGLIFLVAWPVVVRPAVPPPSVWAALLLASVVATAAGFSIQVFAQRRLPAVRAAMIFSLEPVFAALFGYLYAGDRLTLAQGTGAILMFVAVLTAEIRTGPQGCPD
jgi:drug/metabolite transporter (DMT)-like permease